MSIGTYSFKEGKEMKPIFGYQILLTKEKGVSLKKITSKQLPSFIVSTSAIFLKSTLSSHSYCHFVDTLNCWFSLLWYLNWKFFFNLLWFIPHSAVRLIFSKYDFENVTLLPRNLLFPKRVASGVSNKLIYLSIPVFPIHTSCILVKQTLSFSSLLLFKTLSLPENVLP